MENTPFKLPLSFWDGSEATMAHSKLYSSKSDTVKQVSTRSHQHVPPKRIMKFCTAVLTAGTVDGIHREKVKEEED